MNIKSVQCLLCGQFMVADRIVAKTTHVFDDETIITEMIKYCCHTADCGNELVVEGS